MSGNIRQHSSLIEVDSTVKILDKTSTLKKVILTWVHVLNE